MYWIDSIKWISDQKYYIYKYFEINYGNNTYKSAKLLDVVIKSHAALNEDEFVAYYMLYKKL